MFHWKESTAIKIYRQDAIHVGKWFVDAIRVSPLLRVPTHTSACVADIIRTLDPRTWHERGSRIHVSTATPGATDWRAFHNSSETLIIRCRGPGACVAYNALRTTHPKRNTKEKQDKTNTISRIYVYNNMICVRRNCTTARLQWVENATDVGLPAAAAAADSTRRWGFQPSACARTGTDAVRPDDDEAFVVTIFYYIL